MTVSPWWWIIHETRLAAAFFSRFVSSLSTGTWISSSSVTRSVSIWFWHLLWAATRVTGLPHLSHVTSNSLSIFSTMGDNLEKTEVLHWWLSKQPGQLKVCPEDTAWIQQLEQPSDLHGWISTGRMTKDLQKSQVKDFVCEFGWTLCDISYSGIWLPADWMCVASADGRSPDFFFFGWPPLHFLSQMSQLSSSCGSHSKTSRFFDNPGCCLLILLAVKSSMCKWMVWLLYYHIDTMRSPIWTIVMNIFGIIYRVQKEVILKSILKLDRCYSNK